MERNKLQKKGIILEPIVSESASKLEWVSLKELVVKEKYPTNNMHILWKLMQTHLSSSFPNLLKLAEIAMILPLHTAEVERRFSTQNLIHTKLRNSLSGTNLDHLMTIKSVGPPIGHFDFKRAMVVWKIQKERSIFH